MMDPGHLEHNLEGVVSLAMPELPEAWQQAVSHWLDAALAFSGLSLGLGYGVLVLALPLLLLPTAFPELSRPRDALWSLLLAALAPLLLMNRLPVLSSAGFGELIATVLMMRLAAEVGQGRWESLSPDQRSALRHLPRWRRAGADVVAAVVQAAKEAWRATAQAGTTAWGAVSGQPAMESSNPKDGAPTERGAAGPEKVQRAGTALLNSVMQKARNTWRTVSGAKSPVEQRRQEQPDQKKEWVRPDPSAEAQGGQGEEAQQDQPLDVGDSGPDAASVPLTVPGDMVPEDRPSAGVGADAALPEMASGESAPEEVSTPGPLETVQPAQTGTDSPEAGQVDPSPQGGKEARQDQPLDVGDGGPDAASVPLTAPGDMVPEDRPSAEVGADATLPEMASGESAPEEVSTPGPLETVQPAQTGTDSPEAGQVDPLPQDGKEARQDQPLDVGDGGPDAASVPLTTPGDMVREGRPSAEVGADAALPEMESGESAPEEVSTPGPLETVQPAQTGTDSPEASQVDPSPQDGKEAQQDQPLDVGDRPSAGVGADAALPEMESGESAPEEVSTPGPLETVQPAQTGTDSPEAGQVDPSPQDGEEAQQDQPLDVGDGGPDAASVPLTVPGDMVPEGRPSAEVGADAALPEMESGESAPEEVSTPGPLETVQPAQTGTDSPEAGQVDPSPQDGKEARQDQPLDVGDNGPNAASVPLTAPGDMVPEDRPSAGVGADAALPEMASGESAPEEVSTPGPLETVQPAQTGTDSPEAGQVDPSPQDGDSNAAMVVAPDDDPGLTAGTDKSGESFAEPAQTATEDCAHSAQDGEEVVSSFYEIDEKLREAN